jgi:hypothetical protein
MMTNTGLHQDAQERATDQISLSDLEAGGESVNPWEEIEVGRFMPRRIRGSFRGGKLG